MFPEYDTMDAALSGSSYLPDLWPDPSGTAAPSGPDVQSNDVLDAGVTPPNPYVGGQPSDNWSGFFQGLIGGVTRYAMQRDAAKNGLVPATTANGQPVYVQPRALGAARLGGGGWIVIGAIAFAAVLIAEHK